MEMKTRRSALGSLGSSPPSTSAQDVDGALRKRKETCLDNVIETLVETLPLSNAVDIRDLHSLGIAKWIAVGHGVLYLVIFAYLLVTGTLQEAKKKFLALTEPASAYATCVSVPVEITGTFPADRFGYFLTQSEFTLEGKCTL